MKSSSISRVPVTKVHLVAHFSLIEGGLLIPSTDTVVPSRSSRSGGDPVPFQKPVIECEKKQWLGKTRLRDRKCTSVEYWIDGMWVSAEKLAQQNRKRRSQQTGALIVVKPNSVDLREKLQVAESPGVWVHFADSMNMVAGSLAKIGKIIGLHKFEPDGMISRMDELWQQNPNLFLRYSARDALIPAQAIAFYARAFSGLTGGVLATRVAKYSELHFKSVFQEIFVKDATGAGVPVSKTTGLPVRVTKNVWRPPMGFREVTFSREINGMTMEKFIESLLGDVVIDGPRPRTIDQLVDYIIANHHK
jgi:hypothetical protein